MSAILCVNYGLGFVAAYRTKKDLANVNFRNLNGSASFEALMAFCQLQIVFMLGSFIFGFTRIRAMMLEIKNMQALANKNEGSLWQE